MPRLDERVRFRPSLWADVQARTRVEDGQGGFSETWKKVRRVAFDASWSRGTEDIHAQQIVGLGTGTLICNYSKSFTFSRSEHRIKLDDGRVLEIEHVENIEERRRRVRLHVVTIDVE